MASPIRIAVAASALFAAVPAAAEAQGAGKRVAVNLASRGSRPGSGRPVRGCSGPRCAGSW